MPQLVAGLEAQGKTQLAKRRSLQRDSKAIKKMRWDSVEERFTLTCSFGPQDDRGSEALQPVILQRGCPQRRATTEAAAVEACRCLGCGDVYLPAVGCGCAGPSPQQDADAEDAVAAACPSGRRSKRLGGDSIKVGCMFRIEATRYSLCSDWFQLKVWQADHVDASGCTCHGPGCAAAVGTPLAREPHLSAQLIAWVRLRLRQGADHTTIIQENRQRVVAELQATAGACWEEQLARAPPRDLFLSAADVQNIRSQAIQGAYSAYSLRAGTLLYHKTFGDFPPASNSSHHYTLTPPASTITDRGQTVMVYTSNRDFKVMNDNTHEGTACLKMHLHGVFTGMTPTAIIQLQPSIVMAGLLHQGWDGVISRIDPSSSIREIMVCIPPSGVASALSVSPQYTL